MIRIFLLILFCTVLLPACKEAEAPHLPREKMLAVMTDIHLAEVYSTMVNDTSHKTVNKNMDSLAYYYKSVLKHHNVTVDEFRNSLNWYAKNPQELDSVYINVMAEISTLEGVLNTGTALPQ